mmetsp:Transcript_40696/g.80150  ORF Transcript_40696/g.80150 Transcript_40696/m.80150 type:complete len:364 (-) Transcript_40696:234-1325(-)
MRWRILSVFFHVRQAPCHPRHTAAATLRLEDLTTLPSKRVALNYFDQARFKEVHGQLARPCIDVRQQSEQEDAMRETPELEAMGGARLLKHFYMPYQIPMVDARDAPEAATTLDEQGFKLHRSPTQMAESDFYVRQALIDTYLPECEAFVKKATGATRVIAAKYLVRNRSRPGEASGYVENRPHVDYTLVSGPQNVRSLLAETPETEGMLSSHRYMLVNVWRRWDGGNDWPLACCSCRTFDYHRDMVGTDLVYKDRTVESYAVRASDTHKYFWFRDMVKDEALLLKLYDSREDVSRGSLHTAFKLETPDPPFPAPSRESIEVRCIVLFGPEELAAQASLRAGSPVSTVDGSADHRNLYSKSRA